MITTQYGYKIPETNDKGPVVFPALVNDIQQLSDHNHDGANSKKLTSASIESVPQTLLAANWVDLGGGNYHQQVAMLAGYAYDNVTLSFRDPSDGSYIYPSVRKVATSTMDVFTNQPTDMTVIYGV